MIWAIEIQNLSKIYRQGGRQVNAVDPLNLLVPHGQVLGLLGANGAGKTTTIKMMCGLIAPTSGSIRLNGYDVTLKQRQAMQQFGAVLEGARNVYWRLSAWQNVLYFGRLKGCFGRQLKTRAEHLLRDLDLWERRHELVGTFSRGTQQKVAMACALVSDPPLVLLDEPTLGLDVQSARVVKTWINQLVQEDGKTVVLTTHQLDIAQDLCDRVAIMHRGRLLTDQPLADLLYLFQREHYEIRVQGELDTAQAERFANFTATVDNHETLLVGTITSQDDLYNCLARIHALRLPLLSVTRVAPSLEDVFFQLMSESKKEESYAHPVTYAR